MSDLDVTERADWCVFLSFSDHHHHGVDFQEVDERAAPTADGAFAAAD